MGGKGSQPQRSIPSKADLTKLLGLCHPDKRNHSEASALTLAHEVTVTLNAWRERMGVQP